MQFKSSTQSPPSNNGGPKLDRTAPQRIDIEESAGIATIVSEQTPTEVRKVEDSMQFDEERAPGARGKDLTDLPWTYWASPGFLGSYLAVGVLYMNACAGFSYTPPLLSYINADVGPSNSIQYAPVANTVACACTTMIVGRLSDVFGRRWFLISGCIIGLVGAIAMATAQTVAAVFAANVLFGINLGFGMCYFWVTAEMVPMKWRLVANSGVITMTFPGNALAVKVAVSFQDGTSAHWRNAFYFLIGTNVLTALLFFFFYHPPTFKMLHRQKAAKELLLHFDWIGLVLYALGIILIILGLSWGGSVYQWKSRHVIGGIVGGFFCLALLGLWNAYLPFGYSEPYLPVYLFKNPQYQASSWLIGIGAAIWYGYSLVWPGLVANIYTDISGERQSTVASAIILAFVLGEIAGGFLGHLVGPKLGIITCMYISVPLLCGAATNPLNFSLTLGLTITGSLFMGMMEGQAFTATTFPLRSQKEIGTAGGLSGTIRAFVAAVAVAVYTTVQTNRLGATIPQYVHPAALEAGLPESSISALISGLKGLTALTPLAVPGLNDTILAVCREAYKIANAKAYRTVLYVTLAFSIPGLILVWFVPDRDRAKDDFVASHIHNTGEQEALEKEE